MDEQLAKPGPGVDQPGLLGLFIVLAKHSRTIVYATLAATLLAFLYFFFSPNTYQATTRILPPQQNLTLTAQLLEGLGGGTIPGKTPGAGIMPIAGLLGLKSPSDFYVGLMTSDSVLDRLIERFDLRQAYKTRYFEVARKKLRQRAIFQVGKKDGIISLEVTDTDPKRGAALANGFSEELDKLLQELVVREAKAHLVFLEKELSLAAQKLSKAEESLRTFSEQNSVIQIDTQTKGTLEYVARLRADIDTKEVQIQVMRYQATPKNSELIRLETELNALKEKLQAAECNQIPGSDLCLTTSKVPTLGLEYIRLYREVKFQDGLYQLYTKMVEMARVDMVRDVAVVQTLDKAQPAERKANKLITPTLVCGMISFLVMVLAVLGREMWERDRIRREESQGWALLLSYLAWLPGGKRPVSPYKRNQF